MIKRFILYIAAPLLTFLLGEGIDRVIWQRPMKDVPAVSVAPATPNLEPHQEVIPVVAAAAAPEPAATPAPVLILDFPREKFMPYAAYFIMGRTPKEFADFNSLELGMPHDGDVSDAYIRVYETANDVWESYDASFALVTEQKLFFVTSKGSNSEFEYRFDGEFVRTDFEVVAGKNKAVLRGTLTKTKDGRRVAEHVVSFRMEHIGC
jgi:hypothetical protein